MMERGSRRRIWKVERLLSKTESLVPAVLTKRKESKVPLEETFDRIREFVRLHTTAVAAIVISGEPKIDELLIRAWERTLAHYRIDVEDSTLNDWVGDGTPCELGAAGKMYPAIVDDPDFGKPHYRWELSIVHAPESSVPRPGFETLG